MKTPKDVPTKPGDRIKQRGQERTGTVVGLAELMQGLWLHIEWDDGKGPKICHRNELQKTSD